MDLSITAERSGKGVAWNYCFYLKGFDRNFPRRAHLLVYRQSGLDTYHKVSGSELTVEVGSQSATPGYYCERVELPVAFDVEEGDVIGVCLPDSLTFVDGLDVLEAVGGYQLDYQLGIDSERCLTTEMLDLTTVFWRTTNGKAINVNLEISESFPHKHKNDSATRLQ